jgi:nitrite reductase/ring-hydroxylating ferredoxin subunit
MFFKKQLTWYKIFPSEQAAKIQVPINRALTVRVGGKKVCIAHTSEGLFAVNDRCPHNGASLGHGYCTDQNSIVCPVHRYHFDLRTGRAKSGIADMVEPYPLDIRENGVYIGFEERVWKLF